MDLAVKAGKLPPGDGMVTVKTEPIDVRASVVERVWQGMLIVSTLYLSWLLFMVFHEFGHVFGAWITHARVTGVKLGPHIVSETTIDPLQNPLPLVVVWAGPVLGIAIPLAIWDIFRRAIPDHAYLARFLAAFCLVANGAYIGADAFYRNGDGLVMIECGTPPWVMWVFGAVAAGCGLRLWHGLGQRFGLGQGRGRVDHADTVIVCLLLIGVVLAELLIFS